MFYSFAEHWEGNVFGRAPGAAQLLNHSNGPVSISCMHEDSRGRLEFRIRRQPQSDRVAGAGIVAALAVVVFGMKIVVEENGIVRIRFQKLSGLLDVISHVDKVTLKTRRKPTVPPLVVVQQKDANWMAIRINLVKSKFCQQ